ARCGFGRASYRFLTRLFPVERTAISVLYPAGVPIKAQLAIEVWSRGCLESGMMVFGKGHRVHVQEVIPMKSKAYRAVDVNRVDLATWLKDRDEGLVHAGLDVGKDEVLST